jgi:succinate dehydrogenase/fumarate reductase flavoprotein subunit
VSERFDVIVAGAGAAGLSAAGAARAAGARVAVIEKWPRIGGLSLLSSGYLRAADDHGGAASYIDRLAAGTLSPEGVNTLARYLVDAPGLLARLGAKAGATVFARFGGELAAYETGDVYDWPGAGALGWTGVDALPRFDGYPEATPGRGHELVRVLERNAGGADLRTSTRMVELVRERDGVTGAVVDGPAGRETLHASGGVVLATGGFEFDAEALADHVAVPGIAPIGHRGNTGDGLRLATAIGAASWHLGNVHGSYGFRVPGREIAIRNHLGGGRRDERPVAWILVDRRGRRFTNEAPRAPQDTPWQALGALDHETGEPAANPGWLIFDDDGRRLGPVGKPAWSRAEDRYDWSPDNTAEIQSGAIVAAATLADLADRIGLDRHELERTVERWNAHVEAGADPFGRPAGTMVPLRTPPFHALRTIPIVSNTHGGPRHDGLQRVLDPAGEPIPGLWAAGELGSWFGYRYLLGGNLTEALVGGTAAGAAAAARARSAWELTG